MDKFIDPVDSMTIERVLTQSTRFNAEDIIRRFPREWKEWKDRVIGSMEEVDGIYEIYEDDLVNFLTDLGSDEGWEEVFGNEWREELKEIKIYG